MRENSGKYRALPHFLQINKKVKESAYIPIHLLYSARAHYKYMGCYCLPEKIHIITKL